MARWEKNPGDPHTHFHTYLSHSRISFGKGPVRAEILVSDKGQR